MNLFSPHLPWLAMPRRGAISVIVIFLLLSSASQMAIANSGGKYNSSNGCGCHGGSAASPTPTHNFPSTYSPGQSYSLNIGMNGGVSGSKGGFNLQVSDGTLATGFGIMNTQVNSAGNQATHQFPDYRSWSLDWTAPSAGSGTVTFSLAVMAANGNGNNAGDGWATLTHQSSEDSGSTNTPPTVSSVSYVPSSPTKETGLGVSYTYYDEDGDFEQGTSIHWFRDGLRVTQIDDLTDVPNSWISKDQSWRVEVTPNDGNEFGDTVSLDPISIGNTAPIARDLSIGPESPMDDDDLILNWEYYDLDGDPQDDQQTTIYWFLDGSRVPELDGEEEVSSFMIRSGDEWEVSITPHDSSDFGLTVYSGIVVIGSSNTGPSVSAFISTTGNTVTTDSLQLIYTPYDPDGDIIQSTEIRWFRDSAMVAAFNDETVVDPSFTSKGETWESHVRVFDGLVWSEWFVTDSVTIVNTPPVVTNISLLPQGKLTTDSDLYVEWEQFDIDGDLEQASQIRWWVDGEWITDYDGLYSIPSSEVDRDEHWSVQVIPGDGEGLGTSMKTNSRVVENARPIILELTLENSPIGDMVTSPDSLNDLLAITITRDPDNEPVELDYSWFRDGFIVSDLGGNDTVNSNRLEPGQLWEVVVTATDPWGLGTNSSASVTIANLPPVPLWSVSPSPPISGSVATFDATSSFDPDGEVSSYLWIIDGVEVSGSTIDVIMGPGPHSISLTVTDNMQEVQSSTSSIVYDEPQTPLSLVATLDGDQVNLVWAGSSDEYRIYRSTTPISSVVGLTMFDEIPVWGEPIPTPLTPVGSTTYQEWSEPVPVATTLYYVVTSVVENQEVVWIVDGQNHISVDATSIASATQESTEEVSPTISLAISGLMATLGVLSLIFAVTEARRKSE